MRYIRAKDGIYDLNNSFWIEFAGYKVKMPYCEKYEKQPELCKTADTIEELVDKVIKIRTSKNGHQTHLFFDITDLPLLKEQFIKHKGDCPVYGAIWTDKGLIYVAKMNEKGELELL